MRHSFYKSYLWEHIASTETFKHRPILTIHGQDNTVQMNFDPAVYPGVDINDADQVRMFAIHRLFDFQEALKIAEEQISDMVQQYPFVPEDFGFVRSDKREGEYTLCQYKHFSNGAFLSPSNEAMKWLFGWGKRSEQITKEVYFPNNNVAYYFFLACGLFEEKPEELISIPNEEVEPFEFVAGIDPIEENGTVSQGNIKNEEL